MPATTNDEKLFTLAEQPAQSIAQQSVFEEQEDADGWFEDSFDHGS